MCVGGGEGGTVKIFNGNRHCIENGPVFYKIVTGAGS